MDQFRDSIGEIEPVCGDLMSDRIVDSEEVHFRTVLQVLVNLVLIKGSAAENPGVGKTGPIQGLPKLLSSGPEPPRLPSPPRRP